LDVTIDVGRVGAIAAVDVIRPTRAELVHPIDGVIASLTIEGVRVRMLTTEYIVGAPSAMHFVVVTVAVEFESASLTSDIVCARVPVDQVLSTTSLA
jgi:hypothetical protein